MYKNGFGINNLQWLICYKTKPNQTKPNKTKPNQSPPIRKAEHSVLLLFVNKMVVRLSF